MRCSRKLKVLALLAVAILLSGVYYAWSVRNQVRTINHFERLGISLVWDGESGRSVWGVFADGPSPRDLVDADFAPVRGFRLSRVFHVGRETLTDGVLVHLQDATELEEIAISNAPITSRGVVELCRRNPLARLAWLELQRTQVDDEALELIGRLPSLARLDLTGTKITDEGLAHLANAEALVEVRIRDTPVRGPGLKHLARLPRALRVDASGTWLDDAGLEGAVWPAGLSELVLANTHVGDGTVRSLTIGQGVPSLCTLDLTGTDVGNLPVLLASKTPALETLRLSRTRVDDAGASTIGGLRSLRELDLSYTKITDRTLETIGNIPTLEVVDVSRTAVTYAGISRLYALHDSACRNRKSNLTVRTEHWGPSEGR